MPAVLLLLSSAGLASGLVVHSPTVGVAHCTRRTPALRLALTGDDDEPDDDLNLDMDLLKLPRLTTPQRAAFEAYRRRQQQRSESQRPGSIFSDENLLADDDDKAAKDAEIMDSFLKEFAEPDPMDVLNAMWEGDGAGADEPPKFSSDEPDGFGEGLDKFI